MCGKTVLNMLVDWKHLPANNYRPSINLVNHFGQNDVAELMSSFSFTHWSMTSFVLPGFHLLSGDTCTLRARQFYIYTYI